MPPQPLKTIHQKAMNHRSPSPPLHVHVDESTPVHVHVKKGLKIPSKAQKGTKSKMKSDVGNFRRSVKVKTRVPWIPPGKTSMRDAGFKWEGLTHRLEITPPDMEKMMSALHMSDLSTDEEEYMRGKINSYEKKIDSLMCEVGTLKSKVQQKRDHSTERYEERLAASKRALTARNEELNEVSLELADTENENSRLRSSIDRIKEETNISLREKQQLQQEKSHLLSKLVEAEMDGAEAARQVDQLRDTINQMRHEKRMTSTDFNLLTRQKETLLEKLNTFEETNRSLRTLLREQHCRETETHRLLEQKELLLRKLSDADTERAHLQLRLHEREKELEDLRVQLKTEKDLCRTSTEFTKSVEATRAHLQGQLRSREAENNRLSVQIRNMEHNEVRHKEELELLTAQLDELRHKLESDKEGLKKSARAQKHRAEKCEETMQLLNNQLLAKDAELSSALASIDTLKSRCNILTKERSQTESEIILLNDRMSQMLEEKQHGEQKSRSERESILDRLHQQTAENTSLRLEYEKLKAQLTTVEEKLSLAHSEVQQLKSSLWQYEGLVDTYKDQMKKTRQEADQMCVQLERSDMENKNMKEEMNVELEQIHRKFQNRLEELEKLPEMQRMTELKLQDCQDHLQGYEQKNAELSSIISDLRIMMEQQGDKMESTRDRYQSALEENKLQALKLEELERRLDDSGAQNRELLQVVAKREETIHQNQLRLEEKTRECASLSRQLEASIEDSRRQVEQTRDRASSKERVTQSKILDLETQLSRTKTELNQFHRSKEDAERRFQSRLQDLKDRLEQSESTNRSMQNYVQFLKSSYNNVFGEAALSSSPIRPRTPL
ncbi:outer dense fiber protein 2 isoform X2 [Ranitomeya imitator]|uniref:outer dense fiber protein 2 isoform X2 n=2 Tax=Ranitomeya imitator TaxID=111125 RepID=UPI0037E99F15